MQYLTVRESIRRLRAAGVAAGARTIHQWIDEQKVQDVWRLGPHTYIYEGEVDALIQGARIR